MRIMVVGNVYSVHVRRWSEHLARDHDVHLAYLPKDPEEDVRKLFAGNVTKVNLVPLGSPLAINIKRVPRQMSMKAFGGRHYMTLGLKELKAAVQDIGPEIIHAHYLPDYGWLASQIGFHPLVLHAWGFTILFKGQDKNKTLSKQMFDSADLVFAGDETAKARLVEYGCEPGRIFIQAWGVDTKRFRPEAALPGLKARLFGENDFRIVTLVRHLVDICDISALVRAVPEICAKHPRTRIMIVGDGPDRKNLENLARELGIVDKIIFTGNVPNEELHNYLAISDIYVDTPHPTKGGGGIGVALMEAMSTGLPCVVAKRPGAEAGVREGINGHIFEGGDHKELAEKVIALLSNPDRMREYGENSRKLALEIGDFDRNMVEVVAIYEKLVRKYQ